MLSSNKYEEEFPALKRKINGHRLVYLDNAATTLRPKRVMEAVSEYSLNHHANVHRSTHTLASEATQMYESSRQKLADFINAKKKKLFLLKEQQNQ